MRRESSRLTRCETAARGLSRTSVAGLPVNPRSRSPVQYLCGTADMCSCAVAVISAHAASMSPAVTINKSSERCSSVNPCTVAVGNARNCVCRRSR